MPDSTQVMIFIGQVLLAPVQVVGAFILVFFLILYLVSRVKEWLL